MRDFIFISTVVTYPLVFSVRADSRFRASTSSSAT